MVKINALNGYYAGGDIARDVVNLIYACGGFKNRAIILYNNV